MPEEIFTFHEAIWPFIYEGVPYCVGNMCGEHRDAYMQDMKNRSGTKTLIAQEGEELQVEFTTFEGWSVSLLQYCVYGYDTNAKRKLQLIPKEIIAKWPSRLLDKLTAEANKITGTGSPETEEGDAKNG